MFHFKESWNIFIRLTDRCSANCSHCWLASLKKVKKTNLDLYKIIENFVENNISGGYKITFLGFDIFGLYDEDFLKKIFFDKLVQISFYDLEKYSEKIEKFHHNNKTRFFIIVTINDLSDFKNILEFIKKWNKYISLTIVCDLEKYWLFLKKIFPNLSNVKNQYFFINWIYIEIEKFSTHQIFSNNCISLENFEIKNQKIFIKTDLNIWPNGEISFHLNQWCNNSIKKISDIFSENIHKDFQEFQKYLMKYNNIENRCLKCNYFLWKKS